MNATTTKPRRIMLEVAEGRGAGALLENGFLGHCRDAGLEVHVLTPGARFEPFVRRYQLEGVRFSYLPVEGYRPSGRWWQLEHRLGGWLVQSGRPRARQTLWRLVGERIAARRSGEMAAVVRRERPDAFVSTNVSVGCDAGMVSVARRLGIPTLGNVFSWDHPFRRQFARPDLLTCWSDWVKEGLVELQGYEPDQIEVVGAPAFDPYFRPEYAWSRAELFQKLGLDPGRPILVFATLGQLHPTLDETGSFRAFMSALDEGRIARRPQVVLRLHPLSMGYYFQEFLHHPDVVVSRYLGYCPGMRWWPSRDEVVLAANILRHADACVSPGSTVTVETAIFDVPTIIPTFNPHTEREHRAFFRRHWLSRHFRFIAEEGLLPMVNTVDEMVDAVNRALGDRRWTATAQAAIRRRVLGPLDGRATERLAEAAVRVAHDGVRRGDHRMSTVSVPGVGTAAAHGED